MNIVTSIDDVKRRQTFTTAGEKKRSYDRQTTGLLSNAGATASDVHHVETVDPARAHNPQRRRTVSSIAKPRLRASIISSAGTTSSTLPLLHRDLERPPTFVAGPFQNPLLSLFHPRYGLPKRLVENFASVGISAIYPWQSSCLLRRGLLDGEKSLVYTAPTGGGKSLVADVVMLKRVIDDPTKKAILILPYVALVQEKVKWLRTLLDGVAKREPIASQGQDSQTRRWKRSHTSSIRMVGCFGGSRESAKWADLDVAVCTIEKANGLINSAIEDCSIKDLAVLVLDELHMIDDSHRGYIMELTASKILSLESTVQILGMSATLKDTEMLAQWLDARYYNTKYAPVPIEENLVCDHAIYPTSTSSALFRASSQLSSQSLSDLTPSRLISASEHSELKNPVTNAVVALAVETAVAGYGALVFCSSRQRCQSTATLISNAMPPEVDYHVLDRRKDVLSEIRSQTSDLDDALGQSILHGVAFHHAGLTAEERDLVAGAYDQGIIKIIVATCSLAAGVNLPARRVILQGPRMGASLIGPAMLRQMRGRAGRKGKDEVGESFLCCEKQDLAEVAQLIEAELPKVESSLSPEKRGIRRALLEVITIRLATHDGAIQDYIKRTLLYHMMDSAGLSALISAALEWLISSQLIVVDGSGGYEATRLSHATVASYLTPEDGLFLHGELTRALRAFVMDGEMHIFYIFTPVTISGLTDIDWVIFRREIENLDESGLRVLEFVGVNPAFVNRMANSARRLPEDSPEEQRRVRVYRRFYTALQLRDLSNELPIHQIARKYQVARGSVQTLAQVCESFAASMVHFCDKMDWGMLKAVLEHMSDRLQGGARAELLELTKIPYVKSRTARVFWENGLRGLDVVADVNPKDLVPLLKIAQPWKNRMDDPEQERYDEKLMLKAEIIVNAANRLWDRQQQHRIDVEADM